MEELPPKALKTQLVRLDHNLKEIEKSKFAGIQRAPGSLPVLEAFQGFLEKERQIAKRRLVMVTSICIFLILLVSGLGSAFIYMYMKHMSIDYTALSTQTAEMESQIETEKKATLTQMEALEAYLSKNAANHEKLLSSHSSVESQTIEARDQIAEMQSILESLASENTLLKNQIDDIVQDWQTVKQSSENMPGDFNPMSDVSTQKTAPTTDQTVDQQPAIQNTIAHNQPPRTNNDGASVNITITPSGEDHGIRWRLPRITL